MKIAGLQKLTLQDFPGRVASIIFTPGCDFRCPYCHNASLVTKIDSSTFMDLDEVLHFLQKRKAMLEGIVITGGEPLLQERLIEFLVKVRELGYQVKLDTNGSYPEKLEELIQQGLLDYIAMDIKQSPGRYIEAIGLESSDFDINTILKSIELIRESKLPYEFRTTVVEELFEVEDFSEIGKLLRKEDRYFLQEYKEAPEVIQGGFSAPSEEKKRTILNRISEFCDHVSWR